MLSNKDIEFLSFLLSKKDSSSITELANQFKVSERSIRYYIDNINIELKKEYIQVVKGNCYIEQQIELKNLLDIQQPTQYTKEIRKKIVFYHIVYNGFVNITVLSNELQISRSSGKSYIEEAKEKLLSFHLELKQEYKKGLILVGEEENIRKLQLHTFMEYDHLSNINQSILSPIVNSYSKHLCESCIYDFLEAVQKQLSFVLSDESYFIMYKACTIVLKRMQDGYMLQTYDNEYFLATCAEYSVITACASLLHKDLNKAEMLYLTSLLIGSHYAKSTNLMENNWFEHDLLVSKIINLYSSYYQINLNHDRMLYESLLTHLRPTMYRMLNNIPVPEVNHEDIKNSFCKEYEVMKKVLQELNFFTSEENDQDEIALLTLHFKAAVNRCEKQNYTKKNVLIICSHGYGTSKLLEQQLMETYEVHVLDCIPYHYLKQYERIQEVDFIVTTIDKLSSYHDLPILHVSPFLNKDDLVKLDKSLLAKRKNKVSMALLLDTIKKSCTIHELSELKQDLQDALGDMLLRDDNKDQTLLDILPQENIALHYPAKNWQEAIEKAGDLLVHNGYVSKQYKEQMMDSFENYGSYMIIDDGIAIPHAKNDGSVYKTGMTLVVLENPVDFMNGKQLKTFFSFCSKDNIEHLDALVAVANLIKETEFKKYVGKFEGPKDILRFIIQNSVLE